MKRLLHLILFVIPLVVLTSCSASELTQLKVVINSPVSGSQFQSGQDVPVQSASSSKQGLARVELVVDGQTVRTDPVPAKGQDQFAVVQTWKATTPGSHTILVRAANERGATGEAGITINVVSAAAAAPTGTAGAAATPNAPAPTSAGSTSNTPAPTKSSAAATTAPTAAIIATALPTVNAAAPTIVAAVAPTATPVPGATLAVRPTPTPITSGTKYTVVLTEDQIMAMINSSVAATDRNYVSASVRLQNGQISANTTYKGLGGQTVNGTLILAVSASNCDLHVTVIQATIGQVGMTDAHKAAISANMERLLSRTFAQYHDYRCVESVTIANGAMTVVYY